ncbi:MAG: hypothetical protein KAI83_15200 [Thiomargarita sp.]|nr:hypothetical protein [Thiomargarita sp.]
MNLLHSWKFPPLSVGDLSFPQNLRGNAYHDAPTCGKMFSYLLRRCDAGTSRHSHAGGNEKNGSDPWVNAI